jgi:hypothetical protein
VKLQAEIKTAEDGNTRKVNTGLHNPDTAALLLAAGLAIDLVYNEDE